MGGFKKFILRGNVVDLAVGVVIGVAFAAVVTSLVEGVINPLIGLLGDQNFDRYTWCLKGACGTDPETGEPTGHVLLYGTVVTALITFLLTALAVYVLVVRPVGRFLDRVQGEPAATTKECPECLSTIPLEAARCAHCTVEQLDVVGDGT
jgi:large conductance mechanosensitive channel